MAEPKRVKLMRGNESSRLSVIPAQGEQISTIDELKLYLGDGNKAGGFTVNADNTIAVWPDQTDATKKLSLAWWIAHFNGEEATIRIPRGTHEVLYDMTIPENICLKFDKGAILEVADTKTLTINGAIEANAWQIFDGDGTVNGTPITDNIYVEWFGAKGDGITDSTSAIQKACAWAYSSDIPVTSAKGTFITTNTLNIRCNGDLGNMIIKADGYTVNPVILYTAYNKRIIMPTVTNSTRPANSWDASSVGIRLGNCSNCDIHVISVTGFCDGLVCGGMDGGFAYNSVTMQLIYNNKRNLTLIAADGANNNGWCNENIFYNGRLGHDSSTSDFTGTRMIVLKRASTQGPGSPNNNVFIKTSIESASVEYGLEIDGDYNTFMNLRYEGTGAKRIYVNNCNKNLFIGGYSNISFLPVYSPTAVSKTFSNLNGYIPEFNIAKFSINGMAGSNGYEFATYTNRGVKTATNYSSRIDNGQLALRKAANDEEGSAPNVVLGNMLGSTTGLIFSGDSPYTEGALGFYKYGSVLGCQGTFMPRKCTDSTNGNYTLGTAGLKWDTVYAVNGTIQTSDERAKTEISTIPDAWLDAWADVDYTRFKMVDAVQKKGSDNARWHIGIIAQRVKEVFEAHGLDAMKIGLLCYDEWDDVYEEVEVIDSEAVMDEEGNIITPEVKHTETVHSQTAGNLYSIRYDEALAMEAAYMRREVERLKSSINV